jgi:hypothetical protein
MDHAVIPSDVMARQESLSGTPDDKPVSSTCPVRKALEDRSWLLKSRLYVLTSRLVHIAGHDGHREYLAARTKCERMRAALDETIRKLNDHLLAHRC